MYICEKVNVMAKKIIERTTKEVCNRSGHRVELVVNGSVKVLLPGDVFHVSDEVVVPEGIGLFVR